MVFEIVVIFFDIGEFLKKGGGIFCPINNETWRGRSDFVVLNKKETEQMELPSISASFTQ